MNWLTDFTIAVRLLGQLQSSNDPDASKLHWWIFSTDTGSSCWQRCLFCTRERANFLSNQPTLAPGWELNYYAIRCGSCIARNNVAINVPCWQVLTECKQKTQTMLKSYWLLVIHTLPDSYTEAKDSAVQRLFCLQTKLNNTRLSSHM